MAIRQHTVVQSNGMVEIQSSNLIPGQTVEVIVIVEQATRPERARLTARLLLESGMIGIWESRDDIEDSVSFARQLREQAQSRTAI